MKEKSLKSLAAKGAFWSTVENFGLKAVGFIINIVLANLLLPSVFGLIGMLAIFITLSETLVDGGMGRALIQKKNRTDVDYSTVLIFNFFVSTVIYLILFTTAPLIAEFYDTPELSLLTRILCLVTVINSLGLVQSLRLTVKLDFKTLAKTNIFSIIIGGGGAVLLAYMDYGVWALVFYNLIRALVKVILLFFLVGNIPPLKFSRQSFRELFGFGSRILLGGVTKSISANIYKTVIGKTYSASTLGFYYQGYQIPRSGSLTLSTIVKKVAFPIYSSQQDDVVKMMAIHRKMLGMLTFILFPTMVLIALLAEPFVFMFLGEKWLPMVPLMQWLSFAQLAGPIGTLNLNILGAKGRSDLYLNMNLLKIPFIAIALLITIPISIEAVAIGEVLSGVIFFLIDAYWLGKLFDYGAWKQFKDIWPKIITVLFMAISVYFSIYFIEQNWLKLIVGGIIGVITYFLFSVLLKIGEVKELKYIYNQVVLKKRRFKN